MTGPRPAVPAWLVALVIAVLAGATAAVAPVPTPAPVAAQSGPPCQVEIEPNDRPEDAPVLLGELCLAGSLEVAEDHVEGEV